MRITFEHRDGFAGFQRAHFLDCAVEFSEEERISIRNRGLQKHTVPLPLGYRARPNPQERNRFLILQFAIAAGVCVLGFLLSFLPGHGPAELLGAALALAGVGYAGYCAVRMFPWKEKEEDELTLGAILKSKRFSIRTASPAESKDVEDELEGSLASMKDFLSANIEAGTRRTVEF